MMGRMVMRWGMVVGERRVRRVVKMAWGREMCRGVAGRGWKGSGGGEGGIWGSSEDGSRVSEVVSRSEGGEERLFG